MPSYSVLNNQVFAIGDYTVEPYRPDDIFMVKTWRNEQMDVLRQKVQLSDDDQSNYYERVVKPSFEDKGTRIILFSFLMHGQLIGYGGLTNIVWEDKRAELSFLVNTERTKDKSVYTSDFSHFIQLMKKVGFGDLGFHRIFVETYDIRPLHISILEQNGFKYEGRMKDHVIINGNYTDSLIHGLIND